MRRQCDADLVVPAAGDEGGALQLAGVLLRQPPHPRHLPRYELPGPDCHPQASIGILSETVVTLEFVVLECYELPGPDRHPQASLGILSETIVTVECVELEC